ncbi:hypothetical protein EYC84_003544 [Monilinia fructicola]|uniref:Uncharacterized protein n=1 Tax=Monilinia fructicola TaxID=38448 RepID=A0A5M9JWI4_MONFR|nr:hypothetical protein EYC84_003544 [Monilinia fructicola]
MKQSREVEEHRWKEDAQRAMIYEKSDKILWTDRTRNSGNDLTAEETEYLIEEDTKRFTSRGSYEHQHEIHRQLETHSTNISNKAHKRPTLAPHEPSPQHYPRSEHRHGHEPSESRSQYSPVPMTRPASKTTVHPATPPVDSEIAQRPREQEERARQLRMRLEQDGAREAEKAYQAAAAHAKKVREDALSFHCDHWETQAIPRRSSPMKHDARKPPLKSALKAPIQRSSSRGSERASSSHHFEPDIEDESERGERRRGRPTERM